MGNNDPQIIIIGAAILNVLVRPAAFANECGARAVAVTGASEGL